VLKKALARFGKRLTIIALLLLGGFAAGQDDPAKQKAIEQMRKIANAVKQCPVQKTRISKDDDCQVASSNIGPPMNVEWDVLPSKTVRSPFEGILEFTLPVYSTFIDRDDLSAKDHQKCVDKAARLAKMGLQPLPEKTVPVELLRRYEFDLGPGAPELVKMLEVSKGSKTVTWVALDDANACWVKAAKAGGTGNDVVVKPQ
jgi:hypothetical protein